MNQEARGCEREQEAGDPRSGDATVASCSRPPEKMTLVLASNLSVSHDLLLWHAGGDRRIVAGRRQHGLRVAVSLSEAAS